MQKYPHNKAWLLILTVVAVLAFATASSGTVLINEFLASNGSVNADEDGDFEDWVEVYNAGEEAVALLDYGLTDNIGQPFRWRFPDVVLAPGDFLLVWASGKDRRDPAGELHTNFSISREGEPLQLTRPDGTVSDFVPPETLLRDVSMGRKPDGSETWVFFDVPTPGAANTTEAFSEILAPPTFSHAAGFYTDAFQLTLSHPDPEVTVLYTLDGSVPESAHLEGAAYDYKDSYAMRSGDPFGTLGERRIHTHTYDNTLLIEDRSAEPNDLANLRSTFERTPGDFGTWPNYIPDQPVYKGTVVRARAVKPGALASEVATHSYFFRDAAQHRFTLPVVSLAVSEPSFYDYHDGIYVPGADFDEWRLANPGSNANPNNPGNPANRGREWERPVHFTWFDATGVAAVSHDAGVRIHGGWARSLPRKFLRLYARGGYGEDWFDFPFFDDFPEMTEYKRMIMRFGDVADNYLADSTAGNLMQPTFVGVQKVQPVIQFINGEYWGVSYLRERIDRYYVAGNYGVDPDNVLMINAPHSRGNIGDVDDGGAETLQLYRELYDYIIANNMADEEHYQWVKERLDVDSYIDYYHMFIFLNNGDWAGGAKHFRLWRVREPDGSPYGDGRWRLIVWDFDGAARDDGPDAARNDARDMVNRALNTNSNRAMLNNLLMSIEFRTRFVNRLADLMNTAFVPDRIIAQAEFEEARIAAEMAEHFDRWGHPSEVQREEDSAARWAEFAGRRHGYVRDHLRTHFRRVVGSDASVRLDVSDPQGGFLTLDTVPIHSETAGVPDPAYPWEGTYFAGIPVTVTARPAPDFRFAGWLELPEESANPLSVNPSGGLELTAAFEPLPPRRLLHYWDFNDPIMLLAPTYSADEGGTVQTEPGPETEFTHATGQGFSGENARMGSGTGRHLRVNNPLGATLYFDLPTTGHDYPLFRYETRRSNQGAGIQNIHYSLDGESFHFLRSLTVMPEDPVVVTVDLRDIEGAADNPGFALSISFARGKGGDAGNNRFDNITLEALPHTIFHTPPHELTENGWKTGPLGLLHDGAFPHVHHPGLGGWIYVHGPDDTAFHLWIHSEETWAWTGNGIYPHLYVYDQEGGGEWITNHP